MKFATLLVFILFYSCSSDNNTVMTKLINERKSLQDSLAVDKERVKDYAYRRIYDSAQRSLDAIGVYESKIKAVSFSIDSLSKMK